jgi:hypothetical protein
MPDLAARHFDVGLKLVLVDVRDKDGVRLEESEVAQVWPKSLGLTNENGGQPWRYGGLHKAVHPHEPTIAHAHVQSRTILFMHEGSDASP